MAVVYENPAIGVLLTRLGECRSENLYGLNAFPILTQQSPLDGQLGGDLALSEGDKLVVIEFKAPSKIVNGLSTYNHVQGDKIQRVQQMLSQLFHPSKPCHYLGLIHSFALPSDVGDTSGLYGLTQVPYTTTFLKSDDVVSKTLSHPVFDLEVGSATGPIPSDPRINAFVPSCAFARPPGFGNPSGCQTCGYIGAAGTRWLLTYLPGYSRGISIEGLSYANLVHAIHTCQVGARIERPSRFASEWSDLVALFSMRGTTTVALLWNPSRGARPVYLGRAAEQE